MPRALHPCALAVASVCACLTPAAALAETFSSLPPPPSQESSSDRQRYMLELVINQRESGVIVPVERRDGRLLVRAGDLQRVGLPAEKLPDPQQVDVSQWPDVKADYDDRRQRLLLKVPPAWLPGQMIGEAQNGPRYPGRATTGALFNYDLYATRTTNAGTRLSA